MKPLIRKLKKAFLVGLTAYTFISTTPEILEALPVAPGELPDGWVLREPKKGIKIKVGDKEYYAMIITTKDSKPILYPRKNVPYLWTTTDMDGIAVKDINECRAADFTATIAYLNEEGKLAQTLNELGDSFKDLSKLAAGYDILEKFLQFSLKVEGKALQKQLTGSNRDLTDIIESEIKNIIRDATKNLGDFKDIKKLADKLKKSFEESVYVKLNNSGDTLKECARELREVKGSLSCEVVSRIYVKFKKAWIDGVAVAKGYGALKNHDWKEVLKILADKLSTGATDYSLEDLGICIDEDKKISEAANTERKERKRLEELFNERIESMFRYGTGNPAEAFLKPELKDKFDLSAPEKALSLYIDMISERAFSYEEAKQILSNSLSQKAITEEEYKKMIDRSAEADFKVTEFNILSKFKLGEDIYIVKSEGQGVTKEEPNGVDSFEGYIFAFLTREEKDWKFFHMMKLEKEIPKDSFFEKYKDHLEFKLRKKAYMLFKKTYKEKLYDNGIWRKGEIKDCLERCINLLRNEEERLSFFEQEEKLKLVRGNLEYYTEELEVLNRTQK